MDISRAFSYVMDEEDWWKKCPIKTFKDKLIEEGVISEKEYKMLQEEVESKLENVVQYADDSPTPALDTVKDYLFVE